MRSLILILLALVAFALGSPMLYENDTTALVPVAQRNINLTLLTRDDKGGPHCGTSFHFFQFKAWINMTPRLGDICQENHPENKHHEIKQGHCHTWKHGFEAFSYTWEFHKYWNDDPGCYGDCEIETYTTESCEGEANASVKHANTEEMMGDCYTWKEPMRSAKLVCRGHRGG